MAPRSGFASRSGFVPRPGFARNPGLNAHNGFVSRSGFAARGGFGRGNFPRPGFNHFGHFGRPFGFHHGFVDGGFFHHHHCFSPFCGGFFFPGTFGFNFGFNFGGFGFGFGDWGPFGFWGPSIYWPPIFLDYYYYPPTPTVVEVPVPPPYPETDLSARVDELTNEVNQLRAEQQAANTPPPPAASAERVAVTTLVFRDGHRQDVSHYAIVDGTMWIFDAQRAQKIPLSSLDVETTRSVNEARGVEFETPQR
jgi:hypothetical protein